MISAIRAPRLVFSGAKFVALACAASVVASISAPPVHAQLRGSWDANAAVAQFENPRMTTPGFSQSPVVDQKWLDQRAMGGSLRYNHPFAQLNANGLVRGGEVSSRVTGGMSALLATPAWKHLRLTVSYEAKHLPNDGEKGFQYDSTLLASSLMSWAPPPRVPRWQGIGAASVSYARNSTGIWLSANNRSGALASDSLANWSILSGISHQFGNVLMGVSVGGQNARVLRQYSRAIPQPRDSGRIQTPGIDSSDWADTVFETGTTNHWRRWAEASATIGWSYGRFAIDGSIGARPKMASYPAQTWGDLSAIAAITSRVALVATTRTTPTTPGIAFSAQRSASFGLRIAPPQLFRPTPPVPIRSASRSFSVESTGIGQYTIIVNVPNARTVELAGDFTAWEAVKLRQISATRWEIQLRVEPGSHRCNVRIDGAEWVPPPGIPSVNDEFNGRVGLFVAE